MIDQLEEIKAKIDIVEFINGYVPLKKAGRNFKANCPFHAEKTASFMVSPERQIWHCFGACNEGGDIFKFLMKIENLDFGEALRELAKRAGIKLTSYRPTDAEKQRSLYFEINHLAAEYYHYLLLNHPAGKKALDYILKRGITKESLEKFSLGYAPAMWDGVQEFLVKKKGYKLNDLEAVGLIIQSNKAQVTSNMSPAHLSLVTSHYYDRFRDRLMFPLKDHRGNVCGFAGRVLDPAIKEAKYVNTSETPIYHKSDLLYGLYETKEEIKKSDGAILVEGELDLISSYQAEVKNVLAIKGSALTPSQAQLIGRFTRNLIFALDADTAGDQAIRRGVEIADAAGLIIQAILVEGGKDPDEISQKKPELWRQIAAKPVPVYDYFFQVALANYDSKSAEGKRKIGQELVPILAKIADQIIQAHYIKKLASELAVSEEVIMAEIEKVLGKNAVTSRSAAAGQNAEKIERREILEEQLLALGVQSGNWTWLTAKKVSALIKIARFQQLLGLDLSKEKNLPPELKEVLDRLYLVDLAEIIDDEDKLKAEFEKTIRQLEILGCKEQLKQLAAEIKTDDSSRLNEKFRDLSQKLDQLTKKE